MLVASAVRVPGATRMTLVLVSALAPPPAALGAEEKQPVGTVTVDVYMLGVGVGVGTGSGTLEFEGKEYPFAVSSFTIGDLGVAAVSAKGRVFELSDVADFPGTYRGFAAGGELGRGGGAAILKNAKGVVVELVAESKGVRLELGTLGARIKMQVDPQPLKMRE